MDKVTPETRSRIMGKVHARGNRSTEVRLRSSLVGSGMKGWRLHAKDITGRPDFVFPSDRVAVFVDGCFWHGCPRCYRRPASSQAYWDAKVQRNMERDKRNRAVLRAVGWLPIRIWEHTLTSPQMARRIIAAAMAFQQKRTFRQEPYFLGKAPDREINARFQTNPSLYTQNLRNMI